MSDYDPIHLPSHLVMRSPVGSPADLDSGAIAKIRITQSQIESLLKTLSNDLGVKVTELDLESMVIRNDSRAVSVSYRVGISVEPLDKKVA